MLSNTQTIFVVSLLIVGFAIFVGILSRKVTRHPPFEARPLMNKTEARVHEILNSVLPKDWTVMCQVSYGAFLKNRDFATYNKVNSKRADFVAVSEDNSIKAVIEYQGSGHFGNTAKSRERAKESDRIKRLATSQAGIVFVEIPAKFTRDTVQILLSKNEIIGMPQEAESSDGVSKSISRQ